MRRHIVWALPSAAALLVTGTIALAAGTTTQTIDGKVTPSKLPEDRRVGATFSFSETTGTTDPSGVQPSTASAQVFLDKDILITTRGLARCKASQIVNKSTAEARKNCSASLVGTGSAVARISNGAGGHVDINAVVSAFNAVLNGRPILDLHTVIGNSSIEILLRIKHHSGAYGTELATVGGAPEPIRSFALSVHRAFTAHGQRQNYISAQCSHHKLLYKGIFTYSEGPSKTATDSQVCTVR
jgi:hypothetical protein